MFGECDGSCEGQRERDEALRELLSYCESQRDPDPEANPDPVDDAYADVVNRLRDILDGEQ